MGIEIEKKFLVDTEKLPKFQNGIDIKQGYIETVDKTAVRVRVKDEMAFLTIKGENDGATRLEFEYPIPIEEAEEMLEKLCMQPIIDKTRYEVQIGFHIWEVDIFYGENDGLIVAEVELKDENEMFIPPPWIKEEVTNDARYYNSNLMKHPYKEWANIK